MPIGVTESPFPAFVASSCNAMPDRLRRRRSEANRRPVKHDPGIDDVFEMGKLSAHQFSQIRALPFILDEQVLAHRECLQTLGETQDKVFRVRRDGMARDGLDDAQHVLGAVIDLAHEKQESAPRASSGP